MLHCLNTSGNIGGSGSCSDMTVLERQRSRIKWNHHHQQQSYFSTASNNNNSNSCSSSSSSSPFQNGWPKLDNFVTGFGSSAGLPPPPPPPPVAAGFHLNPAISRTFSCPPILPDSSIVTTIDSSANITDSPVGNKRKPAHNTKVAAENTGNKEKKIKVGTAEDGESKITGTKSAKASKSNTETQCADNSKASEVQNPKPDYIHVRARRGQATDSHSLAERVRREKISERMKYLQDLVPGCNKITGKAGMLDEIINYVQSLQRQVEFLSMKLAAVNPMLDFNIDDLFSPKEVFPAACAASFPAISDMANPSTYLHFNSPQQQIVSGCGLDTGINHSDMGLRRSISAPVSMPETFVDSSCLTQIIPSSTWEGDFQNLYNNVAFDQARGAPSFPSQLFTGLAEPSNLKMEMEMEMEM